MVQRIIKVLIVFFILFSFAASASESKGEVLYFFENVCGSCTPQYEFEEEFQRLTGKPLSDYKYLWYNVYVDSGRKVFEEQMAARGVAKDKQLLPMLIMDGVIYPGSTAISSDLPRDALEWPDNSNDSKIIYLYVPSCEGCQKVKTLLGELGETVEVTRGGYTFTSNIVVQSVDMSQNAGLAHELFDLYDVPESDQTAPIIFLRDRYVSGSERILQIFPSLLKSGRAVGEPKFLKVGGGELPAIGWVGTITAGLVAGLNPCSLSMLLLLFSLLLVKQDKILRYVLSFLFGKFTAYVVIGFALFKVLQVYNPTWLPMVSKILLTAAALILAVYYVWDFFAARAERYGSIKMQLPVSFRRFNHNIIKSAMGKKLITVTLFGLGLVVAGGEFLCTGQIYLATILTMVSKGTGSVAYMHVLIYALAFISIPLVLTAIIVQGRKVLELSEVIRKAMPIIKLITALLFIGMAVISWL